MSKSEMHFCWGIVDWSGDAIRSMPLLWPPQSEILSKVFFIENKDYKGARDALTFV